MSNEGKREEEQLAFLNGSIFQINEAMIMITALEWNALHNG